MMSDGPFRRFKFRDAKSARQVHTRVTSPDPGFIHLLFIHLSFTYFSKYQSNENKNKC